MGNTALIRTCILFCVALSSCTSTFADPDNTSTDITKVEYVSNLAYGTSLYNFFQDKYFSAITDLLVGKHYHRLNTEDKNAELLLGGMYLSYGLPDKASSIFTDLLDRSSRVTPVSVRDRALFHLGRHYYDSNVLQPAESSLIEISGTLTEDQDGERIYMLVNIMISKSQLDDSSNLLERILEDATNFLDNIPDDSIWHTYAQYNIGTAFLRTNNFEAGRKLLDEIGTDEAVNTEHAIIKDKANIALAFAELSRKNPQQANDYFSRVRLEGSQTSSGLLGLGWSWYQQAHYNQALSAWLTLSNQQTPSIAKQESLITIPYAYENSGHPDIALDAYNTAITSYNNELVEINKIIADINNGKFIKALRTVSLGTESSNPASIISNVGADSNKYLSPLFLSKDFHNAVKDLQELVFLSYTLEHWKQDLPALRLILEEKRISYNKELEKQDYKKIINAARSLFEGRNRYALLVKKIEHDDDAIALATEDEKKLLEKLAAIKNTIDSINGQTDTSEQQNKYRLTNGALYWKLKTEFPDRMWQTRKEFIALNKTSEQFNQTIVSLSDIFRTRPIQYAEFLGRIKKQESELSQLETDINTSIKIQETQIANMTLAAANQYANKIEAYLDRALYSRARLYDALTIPQAGNQ